MIVVGGGILGLAIAETFSRAGRAALTPPKQVWIVDASLPYSGSMASAGFLARKGQREALTPGFGWKIAGQRAFEAWGAALHAEARASADAHARAAASRPWNGGLADLPLFRAGIGRDRFANALDCQRHFERVMRDPGGIGGTGGKAIRKIGACEIEYEGEAWIDAVAFLALLRSVLRARGVQFLHASFPDDPFPDGATLSDGIVIAAGAWTPRILQRAGIALPPGLARKGLKYTAGTSFDLSGAQVPTGLRECALLDVHAPGLETKHTFGGLPERACAAAADARCGSADADLAAALEEPESVFLRQSALTVIASMRRRGMRLRWGGSELVLQRLECGFGAVPLVLCAGAHKSGFALAPIVGGRVQHLLSADAAGPG